MSLPAGWKRINAYAVQKAQWMVAKVFVDGATLYVLSDDAGVRYGHFESAADAIAETGRLEMGVKV